MIGGSSYASQDSLTLHFGMATAAKGILEVRWPGGVRNRLYNVKPGQRVVFPEIPCSFDTQDGLANYLGCIIDSLDELVDAGLLSKGLGRRFLISALRAYQGAAEFPGAEN